MDPIAEAMLEIAQAKWNGIVKGLILSNDPHILTNIVFKHLDSMAIEARDYCQSKIDYNNSSMN